MDAISYSYADKQAKRINKFIENPDSNSGIVTVPKVIGAGESVTIPAGRMAVLPNVQVDGTLNIEGEVFIPTGSTFGDLEDQIALKADTSYVNSKYSGFKNYIINGNFDIWQSGTSQSTLGYGSADRWFFGVTNGLVGNLSRLEIAKTNNIVWGGATFRSSINVTTTPNSVTSLLEQRIENPFRLSGKTVTVSFYAHRASVVGSIDVNLFSNVIKIGSKDVNINVGTFTPGSVMGRYSFTYTLPVFDEKTIGTSDFLALKFVVSSGFLCSDLGITGVQLEEGSVATPFEQRPIGLELSLCQRYYEVGTTLVDTPAYQAGVAVGSPTYFKVSKRVTPSIVLGTSTESVNFTSISASVVTINSFRLTGTSITAGNLYYTNSFTASAEL